ncbi:uncharacterized protein LOC133815864 isoform X2 [Humulus lupulus]|uniref:uncharacterized protein LOC133815864 isoform X2 n=1 Tax=Humulus lupulus TaxID=3486 RepID=UPI002B408CA4|nr:uncharacterized protein LOC133815864 isoform X2 [Humulus lupulus]
MATLPNPTISDDTTADSTINKGSSNASPSSFDDSQALTAAPPEPFPFSPAQITQLHQLLSTRTNASASDPLSTSTQGTSAVFNAQKSAWIVDSGASDHMTGYVLGEDDWECEGM